ncbi:amidohydrolase family protein [Streptomyces chattanoogensis]|uniref:Amidohydrolase n=1 Tax=Streptomyces chattanoogensis TaxID=66876 RepID=A0A0N0H0L8_9ACTN|nr:amidohydrolase family protein [Streptomyces chattanoogensis]KPC63732.1 amidohydrolase [Streptomyces chattanoogensis]
MPTDVHQHIWPREFLALLRARTAPPLLDGWTLRLPGEPPYAVDPADHDVAARVRLARADGLDRALVSLSSPLGIEYLPPGEAGPLLGAFHEGALELPAPFGVWASVCLSAPEPDPEALRRELARGCVGLQLPATALLDADGWARCAPLLDVTQELGKPLFVHPGAAPPAAEDSPSWWPALVPYLQQLHASWFAFRAFGRPRHPDLRVCFAALAGLAPLHGERLVARGGGRDRGRVDRNLFYETSSYGTRAVDALVRAVGIDALVSGSDRPYAEPVVPDLGAAAAVHALRTVNPARLLGPAKGDRP